MDVWMYVPPSWCSVMSAPSNRKSVSWPLMPSITLPFNSSGRTFWVFPVAGSGATPGDSSANWVNCLPLRGRSTTSWLLTVSSMAPDSVLRVGPVLLTMTWVFIVPTSTCKSTATD